MEERAVFSYPKAVVRYFLAVHNLWIRLLHVLIGSGNFLVQLLHGVLIWCLIGLSLLDLYGINVRPVAPFGSVSRKPYVDPALIHRCLPDELLHEVLQ